MKIVIIDNGGKIPALKYGGTERVIWGLGKMLNKRKHNVVYIVPQGSYCDFAEVIIYNPEIPLEKQIPKDADLVHLNFKLKEHISKPYLITIHGNYNDNENFDKQSVFISKNHANRHNSDVFVHNGLDWDDYPKVNLNLERNYYHFLGKATWKIKNAVGAFNIAEKSDINLKVMGGKKWSAYNFKKALKHLFDPKIEFLGMVENDVKTKVASQSKGLIFPVKWHEPFGLAVIESLYCGSPVFATSHGSLNELITDDVGFTSNHETELINAIKHADFSPKICHDYAQNNFSANIMTDNYLKLYAKVLDGETLNTKSPYLLDENNLKLQPYHK